MNVELAMSEGDIRRLGDYILDGLAKKSRFCTRRCPPVSGTKASRR